MGCTLLLQRAEGKLSFQALAVGLYSFMQWCIYDANEIPQLSREVFWNLIGTANSKAAEVNSLNSDKFFFEWPGYEASLKLELKEVRCYEEKIGESEKGWQPPGVEPRTPLAWAASALPLSHDSQTTTNPHNPLYILHRWYWMPQSHTWQPLSMCRQNFVRGRPENSQERTHAEWFSHSKCW